MVSFSLSGDPELIRSSASAWSSFSVCASEAAGDVRRVDAGDFLGDEAEAFRARLGEDAASHLEVTGQAWSVVASALVVYAGVLEGLQGRLAGFASVAVQQREALKSAAGALDAARAADEQHRTGPPAAGASLPMDGYQSGVESASGAFSSAQSELAATEASSSAVWSEHAAAVRVCVGEIERARGMRFVEPPGFWGRLGGVVCDWVAKHVDVLTEISSALKTISGLAGMLALIPVLAPVMGPIALGTGAAALGIDAGITATTGQGSWTSIGIDGALMILPGAAKVFKGAVYSTRAGKTVNTALSGTLDAMRNTKFGEAYAAARQTKAVAMIIGTAGRHLDVVNTKVATVIAHVPGANRLPGVKAEFLGGKSGLNRAAETKTTVYRVEGPGNRRLQMDEGGHLSITGRQMLFLNFGDEARASQFLDRRLSQGFDETVMKSVEVPSSYTESVRSRAVDETMARSPHAEIISVDGAATDASFGLRESEFARFEKAVIPGSYRERS